MRTLSNDIFRKYGIVAMLLIICIFFTFKTKYFFSSGNLINVLRQLSVTGVITLGMAFVMLTGGIDLSVGAVVGLSSVTTSLCMARLGLGMVPAIFFGLLVGILIGALNGFLITYLKIPALIATLGTQTSVRGLCFILTGGHTVFGFPDIFSLIGKGYLGIIPVPVIILVIILGFGWYILGKTRYGRYLYAIGGNREATRLSGINVNRNLMLTYIYSAFLSAIAGVVELSRLNSGQATAGDGYEMTVITSVVLGGISVSGGEGKFGGVIIGILIMGVLSNGLVMMNVSTYYQQLFKGLVLLFAVGLDQTLKLNLLSKSKRQIN
jgi:ribose/xylose/arabinose/galactoside ABC-type transport system permease subunit